MKGNKTDRTFVSVYCNWPGDYSDWSFFGRDRGKYGKGKLGFSFMFACDSCISGFTGSRVMEVNTNFCGIVVGYIVTLIGYGMDLQLIYDAPWIGLPQFVSPEFSWRAILFMAPVAIALTKISDPKVFRIAAIAAILFSVVGKISALLKSIPSAVLGGIMLLLFGTIACAGISNMIVVSLTLTVGIGGAILNFGSFSMSGIGLAALVGVVLNLILPPERVGKKK